MLEKNGKYGGNEVKSSFVKFTASAAITTLAITAVASVTSAATPTFKDVPASNPFYEYIELLASKDIVNGVGNGLYKPDGLVTRGQFAKMIVKALKLEADTTQNFTDVPKTHIFYNEISTLAALNITLGKGDNKFKPNDYVTREEVALFISRALQISSTKDNPFTDVSKYKEAISALYEKEIIKGKTASRFAPTAFSTRAEAAAFVARSLNYNESRPFALNVLHVNDLHANVDKYPKLVTAVNEERIQKRDSLLLNAGDVFSGTLYFNVHEGKADTALLNLLNFDAMIFGNHEFDLGSSPNGHASLKTFIESANYPFLAANLDFSGDSLFNGLQTRGLSTSPEDGHIYDAIIKEVNGEKVGIFGLSTEETASISSPGSVTFENYINTAKEQVAALEAQGINKIIALTHIGYDDSSAVDNDQILAKAVPGIDLIVGGHTHTSLNNPVVIDEDVDGNEKDPTIIVQAYQYADYLGTVSVEFDEEGKVVNFDGRLITLSTYKDDASAISALAPFKNVVSEYMNKEIGVSTAVVLPSPRTSDPGNDGKSVRNSETVLGNLITAGMLDTARKSAPDKKIVFAVQNGGGIRAGIPKGNITVGQVKTVLPFGNTLAIVDVTGSEIKAMFEHSFKDYPKESGGFLHVSGARVTLDSSKPAGQRIVKIEYKNEDGDFVEIDSTTEYTIATNAFTVKGGDGFSMLLEAYDAGKATDFGSLDSDNFEKYLISIGNITEEMAVLENKFIDINTGK